MLLLLLAFNIWIQPPRKTKGFYTLLCQRPPNEHLLFISYKTYISFDFLSKKVSFSRHCKRPLLWLANSCVCLTKSYTDLGQKRFVVCKRVRGQMKWTKDQVLTDAVWIFIKNKVHPLEVRQCNGCFPPLGTAQRLVVFGSSLSFGLFGPLCA